MARTKVEAPKPFENWQEADEALRQIGEAQRAIEVEEHKLQECIDRAKEAAAVETRPYRTLISEAEKRLSAFADLNREELGNRKSRELNYGSVGYRKSTKVVLPRAANKVLELIKNLQARKMGDCVVQPAAKVDKDALKKYPPNDIIAVGASLDVQDVFWYEVDREKIV